MRKNTNIDFMNDVYNASGADAVGSKITEPNILIFPAPDQGTVGQDVPVMMTTTTVKENTQAEPSSTTGSTKMYVSGGTTPNSAIVVNKPTPNYLGIALVLGIVGGLVYYSRNW